MGYMYQSYCFVLELEKHFEAPRKPKQHYGTNIHIGFDFLSYQ